jgi:hypothetical protein
VYTGTTHFDVELHDVENAWIFHCSSLPSPFRKLYMGNLFTYMSCEYVEDMTDSLHTEKPLRVRMELKRNALWFCWCSTLH